MAYYLVPQCFSFVALKWKKNPLCLLTEIHVHEIVPNVFFILLDIWHHISLMAYANCLHFLVCVKQIKI